MLKDCIEIFEKELKEYKKNNPDNDEISFITDDYSLKDGTYYLLDLETGKVKEKLDVDKNTTDKSAMYEKFAQMEYLSMYMDSNKAVADKNVFSNNIYAFIVKKENVTEKITGQIIEEYYRKILEFSQNSDTDKKKLYIEYEKENGSTNKEHAEKAKITIENFIKQYDAGTEKGRLAIFFDVDFTEYKKEGYRYILANVYNSNKFNYQKETKVYGLSNNNMGLNSKKPYLENKTRKSKLPYAISEEEVLRQKLFFDYLLNLCSEKKYYIYFTEKGIKKYGNKDYPKDDLSGIFMRIMKGQKECEILDCSYFDKRTDKIYVTIDNILNIKYSETNQQHLNYKTYTSLNELIPVINEVFYSKWLESNYFTDSKDIKIKKDSGALKQIILATRQLWVDWFYKGNTIGLKQNFKNFSLELIKNSIKNGNIAKAREQFNLRFALINYFYKEENNMSEKIKTIVENLDKKINSQINYEIESDDEFYFAVGQVINYFISKNKSSNKNQSLISPILQCQNVEKLKNQLNKMYLKYNYAIPANNLRFNNLYGMICRYDTKNSKINSDMQIGGYLYQSLIYKKNEEGEK